MDYTREPMIETVITPKEGCKLVLRNTKGVSQEEYFVDAVEVVSFGTTHFFRSLEKPKPFLIPTTDFEVLEVREPRMILKAPGGDRSAIKIGGGKEKEVHTPPHPKSHKEPREPKELPQKAEEPKADDSQEASQGDRKRNRRSSRRRRDRDEDGVVATNDKGEAIAPLAEGEIPVLPRLISPPPTLISETLSRYREQEEFKGAFYDKEEVGVVEEVSSVEPSIFPEGSEFDEGDDLLFRMPPQEALVETRVRAPRGRRREEASLEEDPFDHPPLIDEE